jgi:predicted nucleic acid-binding protein
MPDVVVDACVAAKWVLPEPDIAQAQKVYTDVLGRGDQLVALDLALAEVTNSIWKRHHRSLASPAEVRDMLNDFLAIPLRVEQSTPLLKPALEIATKYRRSVYDALFVALARHLGLRGVTSDEPLYNAVHTDYPEIILLRNW